MSKFPTLLKTAELVLSLSLPNVAESARNSNYVHVQGKKKSDKS